MRTFLDEDFLLHSATARALYHDVATRQPIVDYHNHLPPDEVASNHRFRSLTELWLNGDHYKWRAMRASGVPERLITGDGTDWERFFAWAQTVPATLRNPLYHWAHMELAFPFGLRGKLLDANSARTIYDHCNALLATDAFTTQGLLRQYHVRVVCTTDDPTDTLHPHALHARNAAAAAMTKLLPTWRPDRVLGIHDLAAWNVWVAKLEAAAGTTISTYDELLAALKRRHDAFAALGCRASDHGLDRMWSAPYTDAEVKAIFAKARTTRPGADPGLGPDEIEKFRSALLHDMALWDHARGWVQQFHLGAMRNNNTRRMRKLGADTGFDSIGDGPQGAALARFLDRLDAEGRLPKTILYNLNPADNEVFASVLGNFADSDIPGKMQFGSAWWFLDQLDGMTRQLDALSNLGLLSRFVGMLTDSRSFLSFSRHEYFRRLLCNLLGGEVERGLLPNDRGLLDALVADVCFRNANAFFGFDVG